MYKNIYKTAFFAILVAFICFGCSSTPEANTTKNVNSNQAIVTNTNALMSPTPIIANINSPDSNNPMANADKNPKNVTVGNVPPPKIGSGGSDFALLAQTRNGLSADPELMNGVIVEIKEGNAILSGKVKSEDKKRKAEQIAKSINGIKSVKNNIVVAP